MNLKLKIKKPATVMICLAALTTALSRPPNVKAAVTDQDKQFLAMAAQTDFDEIKLSQLAEGKAANPLVKSFAHEMATDHTNFEAKMKPFATAWGITLPSTPDSGHQAIYDKLITLSGADFDKAYIDAMAADHHKALEAFTRETELSTDPDFKTAVTSGKSVVAAQTSMADDLKSKL